MVGQSAAHSYRSGPIEYLIKIDSSNGSGHGPIARASVVKAHANCTARTAKRELADQLLVNLAVSVSETAASNWSVRHNSNAAPQLLFRQQPSELVASVAYSKPWVAAGLAANADIGVDIQVHDDRPRRAEIARFLQLKVANDAGRSQFYRSWALREALAKSQGDSVLTRYGIEADLSCACAHPGRVVPAGEFEAMVCDIGPAASVAIVIHHHQTAQHCA